MKLALHWRIMIGMMLGLLAGFVLSHFHQKQFVADWIYPFGKIFINLLKLIAIPLIIASLIKGISDLKDISTFKKIGIRTILLYILTTCIAIVVGLILVNLIKPGAHISGQTITEIAQAFSSDENLKGKLTEADKQKSMGPLQFLVDMVPDNMFRAMADNGSMLQVIFFTILFGICLLLIDSKKAEPVKLFFDGVNEVVLKIVDLIMLFAPVAVFALLCNVVVTTSNPDLLFALLKYAMVVVIGLGCMLLIYALFIYFYAKKNPLWFYKQMAPAQLLAFSTSSSAATLPVTMERVEEHVGVDEEVASFVLPVGATVNMDGTSLYQAVAAVFICEALHYHITFSDQLTIILTALLASIGAAAVPGAGMVMLVIVLESIGFPSDKLAIGLALIFAVDRPLDMCRTVINVTSDATVAVLIAKSLNKLKKNPQERTLTDHYTMT